MNDAIDLRRERMVQQDLAGRDITDPQVLRAFRTVARDAFVSADLAEFAYDDRPLPIGENQTISQPYVVALMVASLRLVGDERVLEIGTGSGYAAAILACIAKDVFSVERHAVLADQARARLATLGFTNIHVLHGDGTLGWPEHAPYDAISVTAAAPEIPAPLLAQLAAGGRLVIPVGPDVYAQELIRVTRVGPDDYRQESLGGVRFVPLIGDKGWPSEAATRRDLRRR